MPGSRTPRPLASASAVIARPLEAVAEYVLRVAPGPLAPTNAPLLSLTSEPTMTLSGGPDRFEARLPGVHSDDSSVTVEVDRGRRMLTVQGQWWYRGEYTLDSDPAGTRLTYTIFNLTGVPNGVIKLWQLQMLRRQQPDLDAAAAAVERALG